MTLIECFTGIANAIREKNGSSDTYTPADMAGAIRKMPVQPSGVEEIPSFAIFITSPINIDGGTTVEEA